MVLDGGDSQTPHVSLLNLHQCISGSSPLLRLLGLAGHRQTIHGLGRLLCRIHFRPAAVSTASAARNSNYFCSVGRPFRSGVAPLSFTAASGPSREGPSSLTSLAVPGCCCLLPQPSQNHEDPSAHTQRTPSLSVARRSAARGLMLNVTKLNKLHLNLHPWKITRAAVPWQLTQTGPVRGGLFVHEQGVWRSRERCFGLAADSAVHCELRCCSVVC